MSSKQIYDPQKAAAAQAKYCKENNLPLFAPYDGVCWACRRNIYEIISIEGAGNHLITGCPLCHRSYCE